MSAIFRVSLLVCAVCTACSVESVATERTEREALEIADVLYKEGIAAEKVRSPGSRKRVFDVLVPSADVKRATTVMLRHRLPRPPIKVSGQDEPGLVENRESAKARQRVALQGDIVSGLLKIEGVVDASCLLSIPDPSPLDPIDLPVLEPKASVLVHYLSSNGAPPMNAAAIRAFVAPSVPGLSPEHVAVQLVEVESEPSAAAGTGCPREARILGVRYCAEDQAKLKKGLSIVLGLTGLSAGLLVLLVLRLRGYRSDLTRLTAEVARLRSRAPSHT